MRILNSITIFNKERNVRKNTLLILTLILCFAAAAAALAFASFYGKNIDETEEKNAKIDARI